MTAGTHVDAVGLEFDAVRPGRGVEPGMHDLIHHLRLQRQVDRLHPRQRDGVLLLHSRPMTTSHHLCLRAKIFQVVVMCSRASTRPLTKYGSRAARVGAGGPLDFDLSGNLPLPRSPELQQRLSTRQFDAHLMVPGLDRVHRNAHGPAARRRRA